MSCNSKIETVYYVYKVSKKETKEVSKLKEVNLSQIKQRRKEMKLTLMDMAIELGFKSASNYYKYETGAYEFDANHIPVLMKKLKLKMKDIFLAA